jgi:predicted restriction endonuclease
VRKKHQLRQRFNEKCLKRDNYTCMMCGLTDRTLDVHHIMNRGDMPNGGYVPENGITLCPICHVRAESTYFNALSIVGFSVTELYEKIGSSFEKALKASEEFKW